MEIGLEVILNIARRGQEYAAGNMNAEAIVKLKLMLTYLTLYLTQDYGIVPAMRAKEGILVSDWSINSRRLAELQGQLAQQGKHLKLGTLKDNVRYRKVLGNMIKMLGILGLPILAISGPAVTTLCKEDGSNSNYWEVLGSSLSLNRTWICLCQS